MSAKKPEENKGANKQEEREKIAGVNTKVDIGDKGVAEYMNTIKQIRDTAKVGADKIQVKEITDHKNISLWTKEGKRIGPMHRDNALKAFEMFWSMGTKLSVTEPTAKEIEDYKQTEEYKIKEANYRKIRARKEKSRSSKGIQKILEQMAAVTGMSIDALMKVAKPGQKIDIPDGLKAPIHDFATGQTGKK